MLTKKRHGAAGVKRGAAFVPFLLSGEAVAVEDPLQGGFHHPAAGVRNQQKPPCSFRVCGCGHFELRFFAPSPATQPPFPPWRFAPPCGPPETPPSSPSPPREGGSSLWWSDLTRPRTSPSLAGMDLTAVATACAGLWAVRCSTRCGSRRSLGLLCRRGNRTAVPTPWLGKAETV